MTHKRNITPATSPLFSNPPTYKTGTTTDIDANFRICNILKFTQNSLVVLIPYLLTYSQHKTENITYKAQYDVIVASQSVAVNK